MDHLCQAFPEGKERSRHKSKKDFELSLSKAAAELLDLNQLGEPIALSGLRAIARLACSAPDNFAADVAAGGCGYAPAVNHMHTGAASLSDLRDHAVRLRKRPE